MDSLIEGEWLCYGVDQFNGGRKVMLGGQFYWRENGYLTEVVSLMEGEWSCYRSGHLNGGRMVMLWRWPV